MKSVVITGGNGFIGSHMCKLMHEQGYTVHIIDNHSTSPKGPVHHYGVFHNFDISDQAAVSKLLHEIKPDALFHFAARAIVPESEAKPFLYYHENLVKTISLLESCVNGGVKKFIFSSTCATFGDASNENISEMTKQSPTNTYGRTKLLMEWVMRDIASKGLIDVIAFRYFNAAGSSPSGDIGENHDPETHLIPNIIKSSLSGGLDKFKIFGDQFNTPDGTCVRDYIHVEDLAMAHYLGLQFLEKNRGFHDFNLGSESGHSVKEVLEAFQKATKQKLIFEIHPPRPGDPPRLVGDSTKARQILGFVPKYTLQQAIEHTFNYFVNKKNGL